MIGLVGKCRWGRLNREKQYDCDITISRKLDFTKKQTH